MDSKRKENPECIALAYVLTGESKYLNRVFGKPRNKTRAVRAFTSTYKPEVLKPRNKGKKPRTDLVPVPIDKTERNFQDGNHKSHKPSNPGMGEAGIYKGARVLRPTTEIKQTGFNNCDPSQWFGDANKAPYSPHGHISTSNSTKRSEK